MPYGQDYNDEQMRLLYFGKAGLRKTWHALNAAATGLNVIVFDGDKGVGIIKQVDPSIRSRIRIISCADQLNKPVFADLLVKFLSGYTIRWDDTANEIVPTIKHPTPTHGHFVIDATKLTKNDLLIIDSWSAIVSSLTWQYFFEKGIDLSKEPPDKWGLFRYQDRMLSWILSALKSIRANVIVIAHEFTNEETEPTKKTDGTVERLLTGETNIQADSSSRNHGGKLPKHFSDVLYFYKRGTHVYIDTRTIEGRDSKSRLVYADDTWEKMQFDLFLKASGLQFEPDADMPGCQWFAPGTIGGGLPERKPPILGGNGAASTGLKIPGSTQQTELNQPTIKPSESSALNITLGKKG